MLLRYLLGLQILTLTLERKLELETLGQSLEAARPSYQLTSADWFSFAVFQSREAGFL